jgi:DNA-binding NarL/FixJ family response regulator
MSVAIVSDSQLLRSGLRSLLGERDLDVVVDCCLADGPRRVAGHAPRFVLVDSVDCEVVELVAGVSPSSVVVVLFDPQADHLVASSLLQHAQSLVLFDDESGFWNALSGEPVVSSALALSIARSESAALSERERQVTKLVCGGWTSRQIAEELFLSPRTVEQHRRQVMQKIDAEDRRELVSWCVKTGLFP